MSEDYEREKLGLAVDALAASAAPIQKRLVNAWTAMHTLLHHGFTDPDREAEFDSINVRLNADKSDEQAGYVPTTCSKLSDEAAVEIARDIVELNARLHHNRIYKLQDQLEELKRK